MGVDVRRQHRSTVLDDRDGGRRHLAPDDIARIDEQIDAARQAVVVEQVIAFLPERHREALWLVGHDGLTNEQAAFGERRLPGSLPGPTLPSVLNAQLKSPERWRNVLVPLFSVNEVTP